MRAQARAAQARLLDALRGGRRGAARRRGGGRRRRRRRRASRSWRSRWRAASWPRASRARRSSARPRSSTATDVAGCDAVAALAVAAAAAEVQHERRTAAELAERALDLAEPDGLRLGLAEATPAIEPVFQHLLRFGTSHRSLIGEVQELVASGTSASAGGDVEPLREELSERELAVLRYLPTMLTAGEIAGELFVTVNTVKSHLKSIYRKLDAGGRRDAVRRARELGLVAPGRLGDPGDR